MNASLRRPASLAIHRTDQRASADVPVSRPAPLRFGDDRARRGSRPDRHWGADHAAAAVIGPAGVLATPRRPRPMPSAGHRSPSWPPRWPCWSPSDRGSVALDERGRTARLDRPSPARPRLRARRSRDASRSRRPARGGSIRTRASTLLGALVGGAGRRAVRGGPGALRSWPRSGWRGRGSWSGRRRASTGRSTTSSGSPPSSSGRRSSAGRCSRRRRPSPFPG